MYISSKLDSGNIEVRDASRPDDVRLAIVPDAGDAHFQWFHFRVSGVRDVALTLTIENAGAASYPKGWEGYRACASYDRNHWFRVPTDYADGQLRITFRPKNDAVYFAYFAPFSLERHHDLVARASLADRTRLVVVGQTLDGRDLDMLVVGEEEPGHKRCWIIARQHPGETMAEWLVEGLLERLCDRNDPVAHTLLKRAVFYVVPNMNPDGSFRGHLRTNAAGENLNRAWATPSMEKSPEVFVVRAEMQRRGVDFCLDVHGDEALPHNFIAGSDGVATVRPEIRAAREAYVDALKIASPDFQSVHGYPKALPGKANVTMATNHVASAFDALAMTLEQPFKDAADNPDDESGWSPARCRLLGRANLDALLAVLDRLGPKGS